MKKSATIVFVLVIALVVVAGCGGGTTSTTAAPATGTSQGATTTQGTTPTTKAPSGGTSYINVGTGPSSAVYYPMGGMIAQLITEFVPGINATAVSTGGSGENLRLLQNKEIDVGFALILDSNDAMKGSTDFPTPFTNLRAIATLYPNTLEMVVRADSGIKTYLDLKGKQVCTGAAGSGVDGAVKDVIAAYGLNWETDMKTVNMDAQTSLDQLQAKQLDAAAIGGSLFNSSLKAFANQVPVWLLPVDAAIGAKLQASNNGSSSPYTVPANTYAGTSVDSLQMDWPTQLVVRADMSDDEAYQMVKAIYDHQDRIAATHAAGVFTTIERAVAYNKFVPFHPGAIKYYTEKGIWPK